MNLEVVLKMSAKSRFCLIFLILIFFLTGWAWGSVKTGPVDITIEPILSSEWSCYIQDGDLYVKTITSPPLKIRDAKEARASILSPSLKVKEDTLFISWIEKGVQGNRLFFTSIRSKDKPTAKPLELAVKTKATRARIFTSDAGKLYVLEVFQGNKPEVFINLSSDSGTTFKRVPLDTEGIEFMFNLSPVVIDNTLYVFFSGATGGKNYLGMKAYEFPSLKIKDSALIKDTGSISFIEAFSVKGKPVAVYKTVRDKKFVLDVAVRGNKEWKTFPIKEAEGLDVARMDYHVWKNGRVLVVFSGEERYKFKQRIYAATSEDGGKNWEVKRIDTREFDTTRSWLPRMAVNGERVAVVWEDSRDIRSRIRMKLSPDRGKVWLKRDIPVSDSKFYAFRPRISSENENIYLAWHQYKTDKKRDADIVMLKLKWQKAFEMAEEKKDVISRKEKKELLLDSVKRYWKGMINKDFKTTYELHDPFYRARIQLNYYSSRRGPMVYHEDEILDVQIRGNEAVVKSRVKYEIPSFRIMGKETSMPPRDFPIEDTWLFIDGKWYRKFVDALSGGSAIKY